VPRLTVELIVPTSEGILLTKRDIEPCRGIWHFPGGTVQFGELVEEAGRRVAGRKLGINPKKLEFLGYIEYPSHFQTGLDSPVGMAFRIDGFTGQLAPKIEVSEFGYFTRPPENMHAEQIEFIKRFGNMG